MTIPRKILTVFGTRPEAIKLFPLVHALEADDRFESRVCVSGQHRGMLDQVLDIAGVKPDHDLDLMRPDQTLDALTANLLTGIGRVLDAETPDWVVVQGDTATAMAGALAAYYRKIPVAHVEAGLRSGNIYHPGVEVRVLFWAPISENLSLGWGWPRASAACVEACYHLRQPPAGGQRAEVGGVEGWVPFGEVDQSHPRVARKHPRGGEEIARGQATRAGAGGGGELAAIDHVDIAIDHDRGAMRQAIECGAHARRHAGALQSGEGHHLVARRERIVVHRLAVGERSQSHLDHVAPGKAVLE